MIFPSLTKVAILSGYFAFLGAYVVFFPRWSVRSRLCEKCHDLRQRLFSQRTLEHVPSEDEDSRSVRLHVAQEIRRIRTHAARCLVVAVSAFLAAESILITFNILRGLDRWMVWQQDVILIIAGSGLAVMHALPDIAGSRRLTCCYGFLFLCASCLQVVSDPLNEFRWFDQKMLALRAIASMAWGDLPKVSTCNLIFTAACFQSFARTGEEVVQVRLGEQIGTELLIILGTKFTNHFLQSYVSTAILARTLTGETSAMTSLLDIICDAVVELDTDLRIVEESRRFEVLLFLGPGVTKHKTLYDFMPEEEHNRFQESMRGLQVQGVGSQSGLLHSSLRDARGVQMQVVVLRLVPRPGPPQALPRGRPRVFRAFGCSRPCTLADTGVEPLADSITAWSSGWAVKGSSCCGNLGAWHASSCCSTVARVIVEQGVVVRRRRPRQRAKRLRGFELRMGAFFEGAAEPWPHERILDGHGGLGPRAFDGQID
mmetsp:Transcript_124916/g.400138  ORF Transcript_124916/g.400138 Transcript_124916/m.400138 type:complete len:485 (+) Transcript_124916:65-1519(+)